MLKVILGMLLLLVGIVLTLTGTLTFLGIPVALAGAGLTVWGFLADERKREA